VDEIQFGRALRALRIRSRLTQQQLADRVAMSRGSVARIEQGRASAVTVATLERVAASLGARVFVRLSWQGEGLDRLLDRRHAGTVEAVVEFLRARGWDVATEVSFNEWGERGSVDVLAFDRASQALVVIEVKTAIGDAQQLLAVLDRKVRLAPKIARQRGWRPACVSALLVVVESRTNRLHVSRLASTFMTSFPDRNVVVKRWIGDPDPSRPLRGLWFLHTGREAVATQRVRKGRSCAVRGARRRCEYRTGGARNADRARATDGW